MIAKTVSMVYQWMNIDCRIPLWVKRARIVPLPKGGKNIVTTDEIRFLSMTTMHCRIVEKTLALKFDEIGIWNTREYQTGFKKGQSTSTH
jgi:retron-type reverse transcriptase